MFDTEPIQEPGFKNVFRNRTAIGFPIQHRLPCTLIIEHQGPGMFHGQLKRLLDEA